MSEERIKELEKENFELKQVLLPFSTFVSSLFQSAFFSPRKCFYSDLATWPPGLDARKDRNDE
jgi:hypothetical protein